MAMTLATMMTIFVLGQVRQGALPSAAAQSSSLQRTLPSTNSVLPIWIPDQVYTQLYTSTETIVWSIPACNVVITLPSNLIGSDATHMSVVFTFTTKARQTFPPPLKSIDYFFNLYGSTPKVLPSSRSLAAIQPQGPPSFNEGMSPTMEWNYQGVDLSMIQESSMRLYREWGLTGNPDWKAQKGFVDTKKKMAYFEIEQLDDFGFGGYRSLFYFPLLLNAAIDP